MKRTERGSTTWAQVLGGIAVGLASFLGGIVTRCSRHLPRDCPRFR